MAVAASVGPLAPGPAPAPVPVRGSDRDRDTATPARHRAPPGKVSGPGTSPSSGQDIGATRAGTAYVVAPIRPAVVLDRA
ncbi:hypothetical protein APS67_001410 [Streptomyces sp. AVP053U2]|nr:hypothetical protein APS67_001410 [Streptomyces sp. AVP053U2]